MCGVVEDPRKRTRCARVVKEDEAGSERKRLDDRLASKVQSAVEDLSNGQDVPGFEK